MIDVVAEKLHLLRKTALGKPALAPYRGEPRSAEIIAPVGSFYFEHRRHLVPKDRVSAIIRKKTKIALTALKLYDIMLSVLVNSIQQIIF